MNVIVGLGNPEDKYKNNRHNVGFILLDLFAKKHSMLWNYEKKFDAQVCRYEDKLILIKPQTFMNNSGDSVQKILDYYKKDHSHLLVVHDDVDLPFGKVKITKGSSSAGHHGVEDIIKKVGTLDFGRLRVGVGRPANNKMDVADYVLSDFTPEELEFIRLIDLSQYVLF